jgi:DNA phosphorothioation system restriction enzyme
MNNEKLVSVHEQRVIDNNTINMAEALNQLLPLGNAFSMAVGYLFLSGFELVQEALGSVAVKEGIRIIMGNSTDYNTAQEIEEGVSLYQLSSNVEDYVKIRPTQALEREITLIEPGSKKAFTAYRLRDLIAQGAVSIKVYTGPADYFHAKVYLINREEHLDGYAIIGSSNFSRPGFTGNSELNVLAKDVFSYLMKWFDTLWDSPNVSDFNLELINIIENNIERPDGYILGLAEERTEYEYSSGPLIPGYITLRDYQKEAIKSWFKDGRGRGILEMATGTGKTITALAIAAIFFKNYKRLAIVIVCPYQHLVTQWERECRHFNIKPILCYKSRTLWEDELNEKITSYNIGTLSSFCFITTNDTLSSPTMQASIERLNGDVLIIADEVHHLGAMRLKNSLPSNIDFRLGLSATPERWYDDAGTDGLNKYFENGVIFQFGLREAIGTYLTEYYYYPHLVTLTEEENEDYLNLSKEIARRFVQDEDYELTGNTVLKHLLIQRARLLSSAKNKLVRLKEIMTEQKHSNFNLFYCGDAKIGGERQIDRVVSLLGRELGMRVHPFTAQEDPRERRELLQRFEAGQLQGLVAIRCLDEGVDVPATQNAYILASSTNPREFVQRRGRVLRKYPGKKYSYIHDFLVVPRDLEDIQLLDAATFNTERKLMARELRRFKEFATLAINGPQASLQILDVAKAYNLLDI